MAFQFELIAIESDAVECIVYRRRVSYYILPLIIMKKEDGRRHDNTTSTQPSFLLPFLPSPWSSSFISRSRRSIRRTPRETGSSWQQGRFPMAAFFFKPSSSYMPSLLGGEAKQEKVMKRIKRCAVQLFFLFSFSPSPQSSASHLFDILTQQSPMQRYKSWKGGTWKYWKGGASLGGCTEKRRRREGTQSAPFLVDVHPSGIQCHQTGVFALFSLYLEPILDAITIPSPLFFEDAQIGCRFVRWWTVFFQSLYR